MFIKLFKRRLAERRHDQINCPGPERRVSERRCGRDRRHRRLLQYFINKRLNRRAGGDRRLAT